MSFSTDYEAYLAWTSAPKNPEQFQQLKDARRLVEDALADLLDEGVPAEVWVTDAVAMLRKARDLI